MHSRDSGKIAAQIGNIVRRFATRLDIVIAGLSFLSRAHKISSNL